MSEAYSFLPINVNTKRPVELAVVDAADATPELRAKCWKHAQSGLVYRVATYVTDNGKERPFRFVERLANALVGADPLTRVWHLNGDGLDCRRANLGAEVPEGWEPRPAGSVVSTLDGYAQALLDARARRAQLQHGLARTKARKLDDAQVMRVLRAALGTGEEICEFKGSHLRFLCEFVHSEFGVTVWPSQMHKILNGESCRQPGFDYAALRATRPTRQSRAVARWAERWGKR